MAMGEIEDFARRLLRVAEEGEWRVLREYAKTLNRQVEEFDLDNLPKTLENYSTAINSLE